MMFSLFIRSKKNLSVSCAVLSTFLCSFNAYAMDEPSTLLDDSSKHPPVLSIRKDEIEQTTERYMFVKPEDSDYSIAQKWLGDRCYKKGEYSEAREYYENAHATEKKQSSLDSEQTVELRTRLGDMYGVGRGGSLDPEKARESYLWAIPQGANMICGNKAARKLLCLDLSKQQEKRDDLFILQRAKAVLVHPDYREEKTSEEYGVQYNNSFMEIFCPYVQSVAVKVDKKYKARLSEALQDIYEALDQCPKFWEYAAPKASSNEIVGDLLKRIYSHVLLMRNYREFTKKGTNK